MDDGRSRTRVRRRDRHGRGLRGPLAPQDSPATPTRPERFGDLVVAAVDRLEPRWGARLAAVDVEVHEVPPAADASGEVALAAHRGAVRGGTATVVVYRRPVELRAPDRISRVDLLRDLVAEQLAEILGVSPADLDPAYEDRGEE
jgi:hypothetical protein